MKRVILIFAVASAAVRAQTQTSTTAPRPPTPAPGIVSPTPGSQQTVTPAPGAQHTVTPTPGSPLTVTPTPGAPIIVNPTLPQTPAPPPTAGYPTNGLMNQNSPNQFPNRFTNMINGPGYSNYYGGNTNYWNPRRNDNDWDDTNAVRGVPARQRHWWHWWGQ